MFSQSLASYRLVRCFVATAEFASGELAFYATRLELLAEDGQGQSTTPLPLPYDALAEFRVGRIQGQMQIGAPWSRIVPWAQKNGFVEMLEVPPAAAPVSGAANDPTFTEAAHGECCILLCKLSLEDVAHFLTHLAPVVTTRGRRETRSVSRLSVTAPLAVRGALDDPAATPPSPAAPSVLASSEEEDGNENEEEEDEAGKKITLYERKLREKDNSHTKASGPVVATATQESLSEQLAQIEAEVADSKERGGRLTRGLRSARKVVARAHVTSGASTLPSLSSVAPRQRPSRKTQAKVYVAQPEAMGTTGQRATGIRDMKRRVVNSRAAEAEAKGEVFAAACSGASAAQKPPISPSDTSLCVGDVLRSAAATAGVVEPAAPSSPPSGGIVGLEEIWSCVSVRRPAKALRRESAPAKSRAKKKAAVGQRAGAVASVGAMPAVFMAEHTEVKNSAHEKSVILDKSIIEAKDVPQEKNITSQRNNPQPKGITLQKSIPRELPGRPFPMLLLDDEEVTCAQAAVSSPPAVSRELKKAPELVTITQIISGNAATVEKKTITMTTPSPGGTASEVAPPPLPAASPTTSVVADKATDFSTEWVGPDWDGNRLRTARLRRLMRCLNGICKALNALREDEAELRGVLLALIDDGQI